MSTTTASKRQKTIVIGAGPVGTLAAIYAAQRDHDVEIYELRSGTAYSFLPIRATVSNVVLVFYSTFHIAMSSTHLA